MRTKDKPETLIQLLASYRQADFSREVKTRRDLAGLAMTIRSNCAVTIHFAGRILRRIREDGEELFALCAAEEDAARLKRKCATLPRRLRRADLHKEVESLRLEYDNLSSSINYMVATLDRDLVGKLDGIL